MITLTTNEFTSISQESYDSIIYSLDFAHLTCTCGQCGCLVRHGCYERTVKTANGQIRLRVCRMKCTICGCTHALLLSSIVPYSQILLKDQVIIIDCYEKKSGFGEILNINFFIDENNIFAIIRNYYKYWKQRILSYGICYFPFESLVKQCFSVFAQQFMQVKSTKNLLFLLST